MDENGRHRNYPTKQQQDFDQQVDIPGLPPAATRIVIGYQPDAAMFAVERVTVRGPFRNWVSQIVEIKGEYSWFDITPAQLPFAGREGRRATGV